MGKLIDKYPNLAKQWHPTKNNHLTPNIEFSFRKKKIWWKCNVADDHIWESTVQNKSKNDNACPFCEGIKVAKSNCLATTHPDIASQWHPTKNNDLTPFCVTAGSGKKVWWKCNVADDHEWQAMINRRKHGNNCPCCCKSGGRKKLSISNCFASKYPKLICQWHPTKNENKTPFNTYATSNEKINWICEKKHEWNACVENRSKGHGCPICKNSKGENKIRDYLINNNIKFESEFKFNKNKMRFDFAVSEIRNSMIEFNGSQHYYPVDFGSKIKHAKYISFNKNIINDNKKIKFCLKNNISILIIPYWDLNNVNQILDNWFSFKEIYFSEEPKIVKKYKDLKDHLNSIDPKFIKENVNF